MSTRQVHFRARSLFVFIGLAFWVAPLIAQIGGGSIVGTVRDATGAPVAGVRVQSHKQETNETQAVVTNNYGYYEFPLLPAGHYYLEAEATGFDKLRGTTFQLFTGTRPRIDLQLQVGTVNQTVDVNATAQQINTTTTELGVVMTRARTDELPLNGRNFQELIGLQAGVVNSPASGAGGRGGVSFHGSTALGTNFLLDGVDMSFGEVNGAAGFQSAGGGSVLINTVSVEAIEEFKSSASATSAEYGRAGGGVVNITTRSGTNTFHGTLFEFFRNDKLNANDFFSNKSGLERAPLRWNQFGANLGGPILHDRLFFFFNYEGAQVKRQNQITGNVVTPALLAQVSPAIRATLTAFLPSTYAVTSNPYIGLHRRNGQQINDENTFLTRIDWLLGKQRVALRYSRNDQTYTSPSLSPTIPTVYPLRYNNAALDHTYALTATALNEFRAGFNRVDLNRNPANSDSIPAWINVQGVNASQSSFIHFIPTTYSLADNFTKIIGAHSLKMGFDLREVRSVRVQGGKPTYSYNEFQDLINQTPASVQLLFGGSKGLRTRNSGYYFQDDWRVTSDVQLNLGLRYEYSPPLRGGFNVNSSNPYGPFNAPQQPMFAADRNDFGPHVGVVWSPGGSKRTVIRSGGSINYIMPQAIYYYDMAYINPSLPFVSTFSSADVPSQYLQYPAALGFQNLLQANPSQLPPNFRLSRSIADYNRRDTYVGTWNFTVQQQLTPDLAFQAAYVGQRTVKLISVRPLNLVDPRTGTRPVPSLGQINFEENAANISYHALELSLNQRVWHRLSYDAYFTWARSTGYYTPDDTITFTGSGLQDPNNIAGSTGPTEGLPKLNFRGVISYALPGGTNLRSRVLRGVVSGWTLRGILGARSGNPLNVTSGNDLAGNGRSAGQRPDVVAGVNPYIETLSNQTWLNPAAFTTSGLAARKSFGNLGFDALTGPGAFTLDAALHKTFSVTERQKLTFRFEAFNALNHPVFASPISALNNPNFGKITGVGPPRLLQVALKYVF
ncbi:MAG: carboxypeptidase regulatory-like domain-containing protein [Acidobacteriota bacterium]|nr:carboxypeptidase regulatory-like domain-containing protein [Acidobacteriota bacterium]